MPSTIGHALAGAAIAWSVEAFDPRRGCQAPVPGSGARLRCQTPVPGSSARLVAACAVIAAAPDADLLFGVHRTFTHSLTATAAVAAVAAFVAYRKKLPVARIAIACAAAHASHLLLDWLAADNFPPYGIQLFWPFNDGWYISGVNYFLATRRQQLFSAAAIDINMRAVARELLTLGPIAYVAWLVRVKTLARLAPEMTGSHHPPQ